MVQESTLISNKKLAVIGCGPAGCACAKFLQDYGFKVTIFDKGNYLTTLLPTGGGRCNLAHGIYDFKTLAQNYPRGEKFLYSVFSKFATSNTLNFFEQIGVKTYTQEDNRIFPLSNSSKDVREKFLKSLKCKFVKDEIIEIIPPNSLGYNAKQYEEKKVEKYTLKTKKTHYFFDYIVIAIGGHSNFNLVKNLGINIVEPTQSLVGLTTKEDFSSISGVSIKSAILENQKGDILFTHKGISGPLIYKFSSINARKKFPYKISLKLIDEFNLQQLLDKNSHKEIKNLLAQFIPKSLAVWILNILKIDENTPCYKINGKLRDEIYNRLIHFEITVTGKVADSEVVICGGIDLNEINPKTMESKNFKGLYFCGEVLDIDGFCGGFNLQNCWSTAFVAAESIYKSINC